MASSRPAKKVRRLSTDSEGDDDLYDVDMLGMKAPAKAAPKAVSGKGKNEPTRPRRTVSSSVPEASSSATVSRSPSSRMRLTVKTSSSKLREATRSSSSGNGSAVISVNSREQFVGGEILEGKRARNVKRSYVLESEEDDEDEEMEDADVDAEGEDEEMEDADLDAEGEDDEDAEGEEDDEMEAPPPPPVIKISKAKQTVTVKTKPRGNLMSVEQKEVQDEDGSDEELSELDSDIGEVEEEEAMQTGNEEDAEGEDEEIEVEEEADDDDELDSDDETPGGGSRASTPDLNKLTKRQRARLEEGGSGHLLALPDEVQVKKHLTAEEHAMRRAEMARRRKNLSEKRNEEEKMETINKLLKKQAPKTNARRNIFNNVAGDATPSEEGGANPMFVRWVSDKNGMRIGVPEVWLDSPAGNLFGSSVKRAGTGGMGGKLIEEVS